MVFGDKFSCSEMQDLLPGIAGLSRQVVTHSSGLTRQDHCICADMLKMLPVNGYFMLCIGLCGLSSVPFQVHHSLFFATLHIAV